MRSSGGADVRTLWRGDARVCGSRGQEEWNRVRRSQGSNALRWALGMNADRVQSRKRIP